MALRVFGKLLWLGAIVYALASIEFQLLFEVERLRATSVDVATALLGWLAWAVPISLIGWLALGLVCAIGLYARHLARRFDYWG